LIGFGRCINCPAARESIQYGAMLDDIGWHIGRENYHKHGIYLIATMRFYKLSLFLAL
jgi:exopolyphosphatase/pppGpp-phosphohydrolase